MASVGGVAAVAVGGVAITTAWAAATTPERLWERRLVPSWAAGPPALAAGRVGWDFIYYWNHRFMHTSRYMWAVHEVHHSSERYNLSTALRQPVADALGTMLPYGLLCLFGVPPEAVATARGVNLIYQFWIHTEAIDRIGRAERTLNSPSHHRVHHGSNRQYLDRNHGGILIVWDRMFGTFEPEDEPRRLRAHHQHRLVQPGPDRLPRVRGPGPGRGLVDRVGRAAVLRAAGTRLGDAAPVGAVGVHRAGGLTGQGPRMGPILSPSARWTWGRGPVASRETRSGSSSSAGPMTVVVIHRELSVSQGSRLTSTTRAP